MSAVKTFTKYQAERRRLYVDYSCWLEPAEELTDFTALIVPFTETTPLLIDVAYTDLEHKKLTFFAGSGLPNTQYTVQLIVRTDNGQTKRDDIGIMVRP